MIDTCVILELSKKSPDRGIVQWIKHAHEYDLGLSGLSIGEIQQGIQKLPESKKKTELEEWLENDLHQRFDGGNVYGR